MQLTTYSRIAAEDLRRALGVFVRQRAYSYQITYSTSSNSRSVGGHDAPRASPSETEGFVFAYIFTCLAQQSAKQTYTFIQDNHVFSFAAKSHFYHAPQVVNCGGLGTNDALHLWHSVLYKPSKWLVSVCIEHYTQTYYRSTRHMNARCRHFEEVFVYMKALTLRHEKCRRYSNRHRI